MTHDELRDVLEKSADDGGVVTCEGVVAAAEEDEDHPLRGDDNFLWNDDSAAARKWRLVYAGKLIRRVYVISKVVQRRRTRVPVFVRRPDDETKPGYKLLADVPTGPTSAHAAQIACEEMRRVVGILRRTTAVVGTLQLVDLATAMGQLLTQAELLEIRLRPAVIMAGAARGT